MSFEDFESGRRQKDPEEAVAAGLFQITTSDRSFGLFTPDLREKLLEWFFFEGKKQPYKGYLETFHHRESEVTFLRSGSSSLLS